MNTLIFLCGMGIGALLATILMLVILSLALRSNKESQARSRANMDRTIELMEERNATDLRIAVAQERMLESIDREISGEPA